MSHHTIFAKGDQIRLVIEDIAFGGDGVGRIEGMAVFVPQVCLGETVDVEITHVAKKFARARIRQVLQPAPERVDPVCPVYGRCAGCQYQHVRYETQLRWKERQVRTLFERIAGITDLPVHPIVASSAPFGYRTKLTMHGPGAPAFIGVDHQERIPIRDCPIAHDAINQVLRRWMDDHPQGISGEKDLHFRLDAKAQVWAYQGSNDKLIRQQIGAHEFAVPASSFFQVNPAVANQMLQQVQMLLAESRPDALVDAYAGVGLFGLTCGAGIPRLYLIERDLAALRAARQNARHHGRPDAILVPDRVESGLAAVLDCIDPARSACLLDPPRSGCSDAVLNLLLERGVAQILYISCSPDHLAHDARRLTAGRYQLTSLTPFDMFPQTAHIEVVSEWKRMP